MATEGQADSGAVDTVQRLDKWLWFARVIKTRTQAAQLVTDGKVRINRQRTDKPSQSLKPGDVITVTVRGRVRVLKVLLPGVRRGPAAEASTLFEELTEQPRKSQSHADPAQSDTVAQSGENATHPITAAHYGVVVERERGSGRPTKRERRLTDRLKDGYG